LFPCSNALLNNLEHANEYVRGSTLRFLCKLREPELLEPLVPALRKCLSHRHPYVRRNAVLAAYAVYRHLRDLYPDAPEEVERLLEEETDSATRRNAFIMTFDVAQPKALAFLARNMDRVLSFGDGFALVLLDLIRKVARADDRRARFVRVVTALLENPSPAVAFEAATTLTQLSSAPSAARAAAGAFTRILTKESDNNVKLIILDRLAALRRRNAKTLRESVMDILRALQTPNLDIRRRTLEIAIELVTPKNVEAVMGLLKKEILTTGNAGPAQSSKDAAASGPSSSSSGSGSSGGSDPEAAKYRSLLIGAIHQCAVRFPEVAPSVLSLLMDFLNGEGALTVAEFVREMMETTPAMRPALLAKLRDVLPEIRSSEVYRVALWLLGQYSEDDADVASALHAIREAIGPLPLATPFADFVQQQEHAKAAALAAITGGADAAAASGAEAGGKRKGPRVLADGTYASESAAPDAAAAGGRKRSGTVDVDEVLPGLRRLLLSGDFYLGAVVASSLTKLALRTADHHGRDSRQAKGVVVDALMVMVATIELGSSGLAGTATLLPASALPATGRGGYRPAGGSGNGVRIDQDSFERIVLCMRLLGEPTATAATAPVLLGTCKDVFHALLVERRARASQAAKDGVQTLGAGLLTLPAVPAGAAATTAGSSGAAPVDATPVDECLNLRLLRPSRGAADAPAGASSSASSSAFDDFEDTDMTKAAASAIESFSERLKRVHQLTGFADPVYCEAYVRLAGYDILLELSLINRTDTTLTNVTVELSTMGDLRLVERPAPLTLGPRDSTTIRANIKVSSTETGHIFGTVVYDSTAPGAASDKNVNVVNLAELHVDILDYLHPAVCSDAAFRSMWADFEWENKVTVNTNINGLQEFVAHIARMTNMRVLTPIQALAGTNFLAANLYARSIFGEDALVNISVESRPDSGIRGHMRIRAKTQGVALSLGDKITARQKL
jgi:coatomer subunit beta